MGVKSKMESVAVAVGTRKVGKVLHNLTQMG